jgi:hypothetical protein
MFAGWGPGDVETLAAACLQSISADVSICAYIVGAKLPALILSLSKEGQWLPFPLSTHERTICDGSPACALLHRSCEEFRGVGQKSLLMCIAGAMDSLVMHWSRQQLVWLSTEKASTRLPIAGVADVTACLRDLCKLHDWGCDAQRLCVIQCLGHPFYGANLFEAGHVELSAASLPSVCTSDLLI